MIKHIVMWKVKDTDRSREENCSEMIRMLNSLRGIVPGLSEIEAGRNFNPGPASWDVALYSVFDSEESLQEYQDHPEHVKVKDFVGKVASERAVVDYTI